MADDNDPPEGGGSGRGAKVNAFLKKKTGPLPNGAWIFIAAAVGFYMYKRQQQSSKALATGDGNGAGGDAGTFSSTTTSTDPTTGATNTYTASGPSAGYLNTGALTTQAAGPMPYSGGDVYVNYPGQTTAPTGPAYPPVHAPSAPVGATGSWWYTLPSPTNPGNLADTVYQLGVGPNPNSQTQQILAADLVNIMAANPQINWSQLTANPGNAIPAGTAIFVPQAGGIAGQMSQLPAHASLDAPPSYQPPNQSTTMQASN